MKVSKRKLRVYEVPISYHGRTYEEGKKIGWKDGVKAFGVIFHFWLVDDLYVASYGRGLLNNLTGRLMARKLEYVAGEKDPLYLHALGNRFLRTPSVTVCKLDPEDPADYE